MMGDNRQDRSRDRSRRDRPTRFAERSRDRSTDRGRDRGGAKSSSSRVYVSNIPYEYRWQDLKDLFRNEVGEVQFVELFVDENDKPRGCGIIEFADQQSVKKCMEKMQRHEVKGRQLIIKEDSGNMRDKYGHVAGSGGKRGRDESRVRDDRLMGVGQGVVASSESKWGNTYGLSANFLESLNINVPLCNRVFVANLNYTVDKKKLKEVFRLAGRVIRVDLHTDKDGNSRGFAVVEFDHPVEAVQAVSMFHNQSLIDRAMTVRMDRANDNVKLPEGLKGIGMGLGPNGEPLKDVAHNLPSLNNDTSNQGVSNGAGILGAVPNSALQVATALSGLNSVVGNSALTGLASQAATLTNLLGNGLTSGDLNSLVSNSSQIAGNTVNTSGNLTGFSRDTQSTPFSSSQNFGTSRNFDSFDSGKSSGFGFGGDNFSNNRGQGMGSNNNNQGGRFSSKVLITNLPATASFKMLHEKFGEFGDVQHLEEKGNGAMLIVYGSDWHAERAIKNLDRARIDGRTIDARLYY